MAKWTKKAAIARMWSNQELQAIYEKYPLTRLLVESAAKVKRYSGYNRIAFHYAYKDWVHASMGGESELSGVCTCVIDDLLPHDLQLEDVPCIYEDNPILPGLPLRPERIHHTSKSGNAFL